MLADAARSVYYRLPALQRAVLVRRNTPAWRRAGIAFIHIPKAAGTSVSNALYGRFMGHVRASDVRRWGSRSLQELPSFAITRNPWDRLVSAFRYGHRLHLVDWKIDRRLPEFVRRQIPELDDFGSFVTEWLQHQDVTRLNPIFQPQWQFVLDPSGKLLVDFVGRLNNLAESEEFIKRKTGAFRAIDRANPSGTQIDYRTFYTPELVEIVGRIYGRDAELFGYSFGDD